MREAIERVIAELSKEAAEADQSAREASDNSTASGIYAGRRTGLTIAIYKLKEVLANEQTNNSTE